jgi:hypothetical protein
LIKKQRIPLLPYGKQKNIGDNLRSLLHYELEILTKREDAANELTLLGLDDIRACNRLLTAKPPQ